MFTYADGSVARVHSAQYGCRLTSLGDATSPEHYRQGGDVLYDEFYATLLDQRAASTPPGPDSGCARVWDRHR